MAWLSGWSYRKKITIDESKIDDNLTDFPVLVKLTSSNFNFSKARSDGYDIRFCAADGTTLLKYERERHDATNQVAEYHVKIPSVSSSASTEFFLYFGNSSASDGADPTNVWDSNFKGVWHMMDLTTSTIKDSTTNNKTGTKKAANEPIQTDGKIYKAQQFDGSDDYINCGDNVYDIQNNLTISFWMKASSSYGHIVERYNERYYDRRGYVVWNYTDNKVYASMGLSGGYENVATTSSYNDGNWHHIAVTFAPYTGKIYFDGVLENTNSAMDSAIASNSGYNLIVGRRDPQSGFGPDRYYNGLLDELRISNVTRSAAWIKAEYNSGNNTLLSYGSEETPTQVFGNFLLFFNQ